MFRNSFYKVAFISFFLAVTLFQNVLSQQTNLKDRFTVGLVGWLLDPLYNTEERHQGWFTDLSIDIHLSYTQRNDSTNIYFGGFYDQLSNYQQQVTDAIEYEYPDGNKKIFERAKIVRPAYFQRMTYQAEQNAKQLNFSFI